MADVSRDDIARLVTAAHLPLFRSDVTVQQMAQAAQQAADMILQMGTTALEAAHAAQEAAQAAQEAAQAAAGSADDLLDDDEAFQNGDLVRLADADADRPVTGRVISAVTTNGEQHTVRVRWPGHEVLSHHPRELVRA